jgi:PAS domain S-box-containing protein
MAHDNHARFFEYSRDLLGTLDFEGFILSVNPAAERILGYTAAELEGRNFWALIHEDDVEAVSALGQTLVGGGVGDDFECRYLRADGSWVPIRWSLAADVESSMVFGVGRDMSLHNRQQERIGDGQAFLQSLFHTLPEGIIAVRADGAIARANQAALDMLGLSEDDHSRFRIWDLVGTAALGRIMQRFAAGDHAAGDDGGRTLEVDAVRADGTGFPARVSVLQWPEAKGMVVLVLRDLTRARKAEDRRMSEVRRRQAMELQLSTARELHDGILQTLTAIGFHLEVAGMLSEEGPQKLRESLADLTEVVRSEQRELRLYVDELKVEHAARGAVDRSLEDRIQEMAGRIQVIWGVGCSLQYVGPRTGLHAEVERQVLRIIQESVVNAARHGGAKEVVVSVEVTPEEIHIVLDDDGAGFPFEGLYEDEELRARRLGPVSLKQRVHAGGGTLTIRSASSGARIVIQLPRSPGKED